MSDRVIVCAGTKRGLFLLESDSARVRWKQYAAQGWAIEKFEVPA